MQVVATQLRAGDTIELEDLGRQHIIRGPFRSGRGIRFENLYGESLLLKPNERVRVLERENPQGLSLRSPIISGSTVKLRGEPSKVGTVTRVLRYAGHPMAHVVWRGESRPDPRGPYGLNMLALVKSNPKRKRAKRAPKRSRLKTPAEIMAIVKQNPGPSDAEIRRRYESCVTKVKARKPRNTRSPWGVCTSSMYKAHGKSRVKAALRPVRAKSAKKAAATRARKRKR